MCFGLGVIVLRTTAAHEPLVRQIRHADRRLAVFPQDAEFALSDLPEADVAGPMGRKH